jgi:hypothetical protein
MASWTKQKSEHKHTWQNFKNGSKHLIDDFLVPKHQQQAVMRTWVVQEEGAVRDKLE